MVLIILLADNSKDVIGQVVNICRRVMNNQMWSVFKSVFFLCFYIIFLKLLINEVNRNSVNYSPPRLYLVHSVYLECDSTKEVFLRTLIKLN